MGIEALRPVSTVGAGGSGLTMGAGGRDSGWVSHLKARAPHFKTRARRCCGLSTARGRDRAPSQPDGRSTGTARPCSRTRAG